MKSATRKTTQSRRFVSGLAKYIERNVCWWRSSTEATRWDPAKTKGILLFNLSRGGSFAVFNQRPIPRHHRLLHRRRAASP